MSEPTPVYTPATPEVAWDQPVPTPPIAYRDQADVEALLDDAFEVAEYNDCLCGAMIDPREAQCYPCSQGQRQRGAIYGASLAQPRPMILAACRACDERVVRIDALLAQNDALVAQLATLSTQYAALVRQGKRGGET